MITPLLIAIVSGAQPAAPCAVTTTPAKGAIFFLESTSAPSDSTITVRLCLTAAPTTHLAKARLTIPYDPTALRFTGSSAERTVAVTTPKRGSISVAASATRGMPTGLVATLTFRRLPITPSIAVSAPQVVEATGVDRRPIAGGVRVAGLPARGPVQIDSIVPRSATIGSGDVITVTAYGKGFTATDNSLLMNGTVIGAIRSDDGTTARFTVPASFRATSEVPPRAIMPGDYTLQIKNSAGTSNIVTLTLRTP